MKILAYLNTYNRYDTILPMALMSIILQTRKPDKIIIFDDNKSENARDLRQVEHYNYIFKLMDQKGIAWEYRWGHRKGAHFNHEDANMEGFDAAWFLDDDNVAEANVLEELEKQLVDGVGAVGGLILKPPAGPLPAHLDGSMKDVWAGQNLAWYTWNGKPKEVEQLYSGFLYRCGIVHHDLRLTKKVFRGETMFTHSLFLLGYKLICTPKAVTWHFEGAGGCRTKEEEATNNEMYAHDQGLFKKWLDFKNTKKRLYVFADGKGDHYMARQALDIQPGSVIACCYPECFADLDVEIISISEAQQIVDTKDYSIYTWAHKNEWKAPLIDAYREMYKNL